MRYETTSRSDTAGKSSRGGGYVANSYRTEGLVLRTYKLGEADRIIVVLTPDYGQIRAVAKGVRRTSSKFGSALEPFMHTRLQVIHGRSLDIISQTQTIHGYGSQIAADYDAYGAASAMAETAERLSAAEVDATAAAQFRLLYGAVAALSRRARAPRLILNSYILRSLSTAGWAPSFTVCARCGVPGPHRSLNIGLGGVVCDDCRPPGSSTPAPQTIELLSALLTGDWQVADRIDVVHQTEAAKTVERYLQFHVEKDLRSLSVMDQD